MSPHPKMKAQPRLTFEATDELLSQLHDAYTALVRRTVSKRIDRDDAQYTELKKLILAVGRAVNVEAMNPARPWALQRTRRR